MSKYLALLLCCVPLVSIADDFDTRCQLSSTLCELQARFDAVDSELNRQYQSIMARIQSGEISSASLVSAAELKQSLVLSQRSWLLFKERNCEAFYILHSGGAQRNESRLECEIEMTQARTEYLKATY